MQVKISADKEKKGFFTVIPAGAIDSDTYLDFQKSVNPLLVPETRGVLIDLKQVDYISSAGLGVFFSMKKFLSQNGGELLFCHLKPKIQRLFDIVKALPNTTIFASDEEADRYFHKMMDKEIERQGD